MCEVMGIQKIVTKKGANCYHIWFAEPIERNGEGKRCFDEYFFEEKMPVPPPVGTVVEIVYSRFANPNTGRARVDHVNF